MTLSAITQRARTSGAKFASIAVVAALVSQIGFGSVAQAKNPSATLNQCANGPVSGPEDCTGANWQNGNLNANNSHYAEGQSAPYRVVMEDLPTTGTITLVIEYDIKHSDKHAIDYLTSFDRTETTTDPCSGVTGCSLSGTAPFPAPSSSGSPVAGQPTASFNALPSAERNLSLYNASIAGTGITYVSEGDLSDSTASTQVQIQFTASSSTVVLAWGGHIGAATDWGAGNSAGGISGSPYHMRLVDLTDANLGNQDRSLSADAVEAATPPPTLTVIKTVVNDDGGQAVSSDFTMNVSGTNVSTSSFPGSETGTSVTLDAGSYSVTEDAASGYTASYSADCTGTIVAGETKTCTITNDDEDQGPTTGTLIVIKNVVNDDGGSSVASDFTMDVSGTNVSDASFPGSETGTTVTLEAGAYAVTETEDAGYAASYEGCSGTIAAGETKTCTITNDDIAPILTVTKLVNGGEKDASEFTLLVDQTTVSSGVATPFDAGTYTVSEVNDPAYASAISGDCDVEGGITLALGDVKECTITNTIIVVPEETGTITVVKVVEGGNAQVSDFPLFIGQTSVTSGDAETLPVGNYTVSETNEEANYVGSFSGDCDENGNVSLSADQDLTCTITNTYTPPAPTDGNVTVTKVVVNDNDGTSQVSDFTLSVGQTAVTSGDTNAFAAGDYVISESGPSGYTATFTGDCDAQGNLTVVAGESYACTITNDDIFIPEEEPTQGTLTVVKVVINNDGGSAGVSDFPLFIGQTQVTSGTANSLPAGTYVVSETASADYVSSFSGDCDVNGVVNLEDGDAKTCTITNDDKAPLPPGGSAPPAGQLIVVTVVVNDGGGEAMPSSFLMTVGDGVSTTSSFAGMGAPGFSMSQPPGAYVVNGSSAPSYTQSQSANCNGTLSIGQTVTCVVTYTYQPPTGGSPTPPTPPSGPVPQVLGDSDTDTTDQGPVPQVLGVTDEELPVTGMPAWTLSALLLAAAPFLRRKRA